MIQNNLLAIFALILSRISEKKNNEFMERGEGGGGVVSDTNNFLAEFLDFPKKTPIFLQPSLYVGKVPNGPPPMFRNFPPHNHVFSLRERP